MLAFAGVVLAVIALVKMSELRGELARLRPGLDTAVSATPVAMPPAQPAVPPEPELPSASPPVAPPSVRPPRRDIEALLALRWGMILGAGALLLAGVFLVRYAADEGLLTPPVRCIGLALAGSGLIALAEGLRRRWAGDRRQDRTGTLPDLAPAALAAGGSAMLFAGAYAAGFIYRLVPPSGAFALTAAVALGALAASLRFGQLVAAVGIVGAFAIPALVQDGRAGPAMLFGYLLLVTIAALAVQRRAGWTWLGWASLLAGSGWIGVAAAAAGSRAPLDWMTLWAPAAFAPLLALLHLGGPWCTTTVRGVMPRAIAAVGLPGTALLLLAVVTGAPAAPLALELLVAVAILAAWRDPLLVRSTWLAALLPLLLFAGWCLGWNQNGRLGDVPAATPASVLIASIAGLWFGRQPAGARAEGRRQDALAWTLLPAAVPVLALFIAHLHDFGPGALAWIGAALALAVGLAACAARHPGPQPAGLLSVGVAGALALALSWIAQAIGLALPALAGTALVLPLLARVAIRSSLPAAKPVMLTAGIVLLAVTAGHLLRISEAAISTGTSPWTACLPALAIGLAGFAIAARMLAEASGSTTRLLEAGVALLASAFVACLIHVVASAGQPDFVEDALQLAAFWLQALGWLILARAAASRTKPLASDNTIGRVGVAAASFGSLVLIAASPLWLPLAVGPWPLLDALLAGYALPALAALAAGRVDAAPRAWLDRLALLDGFVWITLEIRHLFHAHLMTLAMVPFSEAELWTLSGGWLDFGAALIGAGLVLRRRGPRLAGLLMLGATTAKVLLIDMSALAGLWRVLSFLGLGLTLIALGTAYRRVAIETLGTPNVGAPRKPEELQ